MSTMDELQIGSGTPGQTEQKPVTAAATPEEIQAATIAKAAPKCGFCGMDPLRIHIDDVKQDIGTGNPLLVRTVCCQGCRAALGVQVLGQMKMAPSSVDPRFNPTSRKGYTI